MFKAEDIAEYYNTTQIHYEQWWDLARSYSLHYGIWNDTIKNFTEAAINTNKVMMELSEIQDDDRILDAGCGVGGAAIFLCLQKNVRVTGITLSQKQIDFANALANKKGLSDSVDFQLMDYTQTSYPDESFDVIWACESVSSCPDKSLFINEAHRLLKKGGKLILSDCFLTEDNQFDSKNWTKKWGKTWAVSNLSSGQSFVKTLDRIGFSNTKMIDYTNHIQRSAKRMYYASLLAAIPSELYKIINPKVSRFAKNHYKCGIYQYKALRENLWRYKVIVSVKDT
ncbi:MAG: methyltransferase domain-containing protein [Cyclobacteriaceae bacterium]